MGKHDGELISVEDALAKIIENTPQLPAEPVPVVDSVERILAANVTAAHNHPPFDNSAMDGYAVRAADVAGASEKTPVELPALETIGAGSGAETTLDPGKAVRIMTGAAVPAGADTVIMQERTERIDDRRVRFLREPRPGDNIRKAGEDVRAGDELMQAGTRIRPLEVALMTSQGMTEVSVIRKPRVGILATGDELVEPGKPLSRGQIWNSNGPALAAGLARWGIPTTDILVARDTLADIEGRMKDLIVRADVILVSGGVSVGEFDYCKPVFEKLGIRQVFWGVAVKPGKPLYFGVLETNGARKLVFGLPGNPVSVLVGLEEFVRPALEKLQGHTFQHDSFHLTGTATNDYPKLADRQTYLFCRVVRGTDGYELTIIRPQGSGMIGMACQANALAINKTGSPPIRKGDKLPFRWLK